MITKVDAFKANIPDMAGKFDERLYPTEHDAAIEYAVWKMECDQRSQIVDIGGLNISNGPQPRHIILWLVEHKEWIQDMIEQYERDAGLV